MNGQIPSDRELLDKIHELPREKQKAAVEILKGLLDSQGGARKA